MSLELAMEQLLEACCTSDPKRSMGLGADNMTLIVVLSPGRRMRISWLFDVEEPWVSMG
jgi:hypothetical protein